MLRAIVLGSSVAALAAFVAGCSAGSSPSESIEHTSDALFSNDKAAFDYFLGKGLTNYQAAGIVGNLDQESGVDPLAVQPGGPGRGIAQWSTGGRWDSDPNDNATWFAGQENESVDSLQLQLDFIWYELTTFSTFGLASLQSSTNVADATTVFQDDFEICGTCDASQRISYAQDVLNAYGDDMGSSDAGSGAPSCTVPGLGDGVCILTTDCAAMAGYTATPGYCPGPSDEQCCTPPSGGTTSSTSADAVSSSSASSTTSGAGGASSNGASVSSASVDAAATTSSGGPSSGGSSPGTSSSGGAPPSNSDMSTEPGGVVGTSCSASPSGAGWPPSGLAFIGLAGLFVSRRKKASRRV